MAEFYVYDFESGEQLSDEMCGCLNAFNTFKQAMEVCRKVSKKNAGKYSVQVAISTVVFENGIDLEA